MTDDLKSRAIAGLSWSFVGQIVKQVFQFVVNVALAHLLSPADFGLVAMAMVFINFASVFADMGVSSALIQRKHVTESHWSSAFWLNIIFGGVLTLFFCLCSPLIANFYHRQELSPIIFVLSFSFLLSSFTIVQQTILTKNMEFRVLMVRDIGAVFLSGVVAIFLAFKGWGVWSLVVQMLVSALLHNFFLWGSSTWRPKFIFSIGSLKDFFFFSTHLTGFQVVNYFARNLDQMLIGKFLGSEVLGYYSLAYKLMMLPLQNISWVLSKVMFPVLSKVHDDIERLQRAYIKMLRSISILTFPLMTLLFVLAPQLIRVIYGEKWSAVSDLVRVLCFCGMFQSLGTISGLIYQSVGKTNVQLRMGLINTFIIFVVLVSCIHYGLYAVTVGYAVISIIWVHISMGVVCRVISLPYGTMYKSILPSFVISAVLLVFTASVKSVLMAHDWFKIGIITVNFVAIYVVLLFMMGEIKIEKRKVKFNLL
ncbi:MAG: MOP flippase family protein [Candidatus Omnitrophica bacterium]|nr:MOP flippase family protein [Candidatus Omnitrophota bacterium]